MCNNKLGKEKQNTIGTEGKLICMTKNINDAHNYTIQEEGKIKNCHNKFEI